MSRPPLFRDSVIVERVLQSTGSTLRVELVPLEGERVRIRQAWRKRAGGEAFHRAPDHELSSLPFAQLKIPGTFTEVFEGVPLADEDAPHNSPSAGNAGKKGSRRAA